MKNRNPKLLPFLILFSALVHAAVLYLGPPPYSRMPEPPSRRERLVMVNLAPPAPSLAESPPPELPPPEPLPAASPPAALPPAAPQPAEPASTEIPMETPALPAAGLRAEYSPEDSGPLEEELPALPLPPEKPAPPPGPAREEILSRYARRIRSLIDQEKTYPYQARRQEQEGTVEIRFTLSRQGALVGEPALGKKSRYERLNASALAAVKNAAPFPPFPGEIGEEEMSFQVTVAFSLK